jgi:membrane protease YdiL (CAAX protease family)
METMSRNRVQKDSDLPPRSDGDGMAAKVRGIHTDHKGQASHDHGPANVDPAAGHLAGRVPWGWREVLFALLIAVAPVLALTLLSLGASSTTSTSSKATTGVAVATVVSALVVDLWYVGWAWHFSLHKFRLQLTSWGFRPPVWAMVWLIPLSLVIVYAVTAVHDHFIHVPQQSVVGAFPHTTIGAVLFVALACVIAPILEETFYRGFLFQGLASSLGPVWGAVISAAIFSASHQQATVFIPLFTLGLLLCWVFYRSGSLWTNIALHATFNTIAILAWALGHG